MHWMLFLFCWKSSPVHSDWKKKQQPWRPYRLWVPVLRFGFSQQRNCHHYPWDVFHIVMEVLLLEKKHQGTALFSSDTLTAWQLAPRSQGGFWILMRPLCLLSRAKSETCTLGSSTVQIPFIIAASSDILKVCLERNHTHWTPSTNELWQVNNLQQWSFEVWAWTVLGSWQYPMGGSHTM